MAMTDYQFVLYRDTAGNWRWYLWNKQNRRKIANSGEYFYSKENCERSIELVRSVAPYAPMVTAG